MVAGLLSLLGLGLPKTLLPANDENPKGYFESPVFMDLNDRLLAAVDSSWADWRMIDPRALADLQSSEAAGQIRAAVTAEFDTARIFVIKDPRICRLLPIWTLQERIEAVQQNAVAAERRGLDAVAIIEARFAALIAERERELGQRLDREMQKIAAERARAQEDYAHQLDALAQAREEMKRENKRIEDEYYTTKLKLMLSEQDLARYSAPFIRRLVGGLVGQAQRPKLS